ncbi:MAG TPA: adenylate/guanylate cyclase domain-containing protein [Burkholderiaceae bacterium]|nr:adenylate/guanylate cyclase domain-containing protein [Burkholderiaceae bacterium]
MTEIDAGPAQFTSRLAAVLVADAVGYSRLMSQDAEATVRTLDAARSVFKAQVHLHAGRVIDMAGDSVMAVFETAVGAVKAASTVMRQIAATNQGLPANRVMQFRIGVNLGDVIEKPDGTVYGDGINIASRLQNLAQPGEVVITEAVYASVRGKLPLTFVDIGENLVKNIDYPVHCYKAQIEANSAPSAEPVRPSSPTSPAPALELPNKPSIAVLPLNNMSGDPEQTFFSDGISEDIITELSRFKSLFVIARNSSFTYKGTYPDIRTVGRELGVRYVLEGSVRKAGNRIRVTAQLIDTTTGSHVWAEKYDRDLDDVFELQEELTGHIVSAIAPEIMAVELAEARRRHPHDLNSHEMALKARALLWKASVAADVSLRESAIDQARAALETDPNNVLALCVIAQGMWHRIYFNTSTNRLADWEAGMDAVNRAIDIDPSDSFAHGCKGALQGVAPHESKLDDALFSLRHAHTLNPNDPSILSMLGSTEACAGRPDAGADYLTQALRMNPRDPRRYVTRLNLAMAYLIGEHYQHCIDQCHEALCEHPESPVARTLLAASYAATGEIEQARQNLQAAQLTAPDMVNSRMAGDVRFGRDTDRVRYTTLLSVAAGLTDPSVVSKVCRPVQHSSTKVESLPRRRAADLEARNRRATDGEARRRRSTDTDVADRSASDTAPQNGLKLVSNGQPE